MLENKNEIVIAAPLETVWDILLDLDQYSMWNPLLYQASGKVEVGETVIVYAKTGTKDMMFTCKVTRVDPLREFAWRFPVIHPILFRGEHIFRIEPIDVDRVKFIDREWFKGLLLPTQAKDLKTNGLLAMIEMGKALKDRAERISVDAVAL
jgi:hypothetical protein